MLTSVVSIFTNVLSSAHAVANGVERLEAILPQSARTIHVIDLIVHVLFKQPQLAKFSTDF